MAVKGQKLGARWTKNIDKKCKYCGSPVKVRYNFQTPVCFEWECQKKYQDEEREKVQSRQKRYREAKQLGRNL